MIDALLPSQKGFEAVVLAGGFGTRLANVVSDLPKPMAPVAGRPFLEYLLDALAHRGCSRAILATGYMSDKIESHFGLTYKGMEICYSREIEPLGTGGAIKKALSKCEQDVIVVLNGDTLFDVDISGLLQAQRDEDLDLVLALREVEDASRYGSVEVHEGRITKFREKGVTGSGIVTGGVYAMKTNLLDEMPCKFSFETDFEESRVGKIPIGSYIDAGYFIDIGIPSDYARAQIEFEKGFRKAAFFDRDGTINVDTGHLHEIDKLELIDGMPQIIRMHNEAGDYVVVVTNQAGIAKGLYSIADMHRLHVALNERLREEWGAHVDAFHFCPHHPDYTGRCFCRKPEPGLLLEAARMHMIDLGSSIMYGNSATDERAAKAAGVGRYTDVLDIKEKRF